ncbi:hypothetical protein ACWGJN_30830, partial [Streptomyces sp. NPDC054865]
APPGPAPAPSRPPPGGRGGAPPPPTPPLAVQGIKRAVDSFADAALPAALDRVAMTAALTLTSDDCREGYGAGAARRPPEFRGA